MKSRRRRQHVTLRALWWAAAIALPLQLVLVQTVHARVPPPVNPLEQWTLGPAPAPAAVVPTPSAVPQPAPADSLAPSLLPELGPVAADSLADEIVEVVRCRQLLVSGTERAALLGRMLQRGIPLNEATRQLGIVDHQETVREYALADLQPALRTQIETLPDSAWSDARSWRGRTAFVQVLSREQRARSTIPKLGKGLDDAARQRLARLQRLQQRDARQQQNLDPDVEPAAVTDQKQPEYPAAATGGGTVVLLVDVGRLGEVLDVRVESSTDPIFESPAIDAARRSRYSAARRPPGIAEPGTVRLTYRFQAPDQNTTQDQQR